jgi:hypothetical protein
VDNESQIVNLVCDDGSSATISVIRLGGRRYRIVDPLIAMVSETIGYGDVIEADAAEDDKLIVRQIVEKGAFTTFEFCLPAGWAELEPVKKVLAKAESLGGAWEGVFGGILMISLPSNVNYDPSDDIAAVYK